MVLLSGLKAFFLGKIFGKHAPAVAVRTGAVNGADGARESLDMMEILPRIIAQSVKRQAAFGPGLVEWMAEHGPFGDFQIDARRNE